MKSENVSFIMNSIKVKTEENIPATMIDLFSDHIE